MRVRYKPWATDEAVDERVTGVVLSFREVDGRVYFLVAWPGRTVVEEILSTFVEAAR